MGIGSSLRRPTGVVPRLVALPIDEACVKEVDRDRSARHLVAPLRPATGPSTVGVAQSVRAPDCGSGGRRFKTGHSPHPSLNFTLTS